MKNIVIVGAGFGGIRAAILLERGLKHYKLTDRYRIILIERNSYHTFTPTLYEAATTSKETANYLELQSITTFPLRDIFAGRAVEVVNSTVTALDLLRGDVHCAGVELRFDYLVLAMGSETNFFNIPGLERYALSLKTFSDALKLRNKIVEVYAEKAQNHASGNELKILIGGAGSTGVELAGELHGWLRELKDETRAECSAKITMVSASPTVLPGFRPAIISKAELKLRNLGTELLMGEKIQEASEREVVLASGKILPYDILIWTGGVKASMLVSTLPLKNDSGRALVANEMMCFPQSEDLKLYGTIYGLGDIICLYDSATGKPIPLTARTAIAQGEIVARNILEDIKFAEQITKSKKYAAYKPTEYPYITPVGGKYAIAKIGPVVIAGFAAWIFKGLVELNYLLSILPVWRAVRVWLRGLSIFIKNDRLG